MGNGQKDFFSDGDEEFSTGGHGPTQTKEEAMELLKKYRKSLIARGRALAILICEKEGTVHTRRIYSEMKKEILDSGVGSYWLGCLFTKKEFEWTGNWHNSERAISEETENYHGGNGIKVWRLKDH